jgi:hypothetical protein
MDKMAPTETVLQLLLEEQQGVAVAMKDRLKKHIASTPMEHHLPKHVRDGDFAGCWAVVPAVALASSVQLKVWKVQLEYRVACWLMALAGCM